MWRTLLGLVLLALLASGLPFPILAEESLPVEPVLPIPDELPEEIPKFDTEEILEQTSVPEESLPENTEALSMSLTSEPFSTLFTGVGQTAGDSVSDHMQSGEWYLGQTNIEFSSPGFVRHIVVFPDINDPDFIDCKDTVYGTNTLNIWLGRGTTPAEAMVHHFPPEAREPREDGGCLYTHEEGVFVYPGTKFQFLLNSGYGPAVAFDYLGAESAVDASLGSAQISDSNRPAHLLIWKEDSETITSLKYLASIGEDPPPLFGTPLDSTYVFRDIDISFADLASRVVLADGMHETPLGFGFPLSLPALNSPQYFKKAGTLEYVRAKLSSYHERANTLLSFRLGDRDCVTPEKYLFEWGIYDGGRNIHGNEVIIGPFSGSQCDFDALDPENPQNTVRYVEAVSNGQPFGLGAGDNQQGIIDITLYSNEESGPRVSNVLFLPGFLGSRLYTHEDTGARKLWEPNGADDIRDLAMNDDGTSKLSVYVGDIVDRITIDTGITPLKLGSVYGNLMEYLDTLDIEQWSGYSYDWRYDVFDVIRGGTVREDDSRDYLLPLVEELAESSRTGKVTIIGHSNGGLLAKALMLELESQGLAHQIDQIILIGSPQAGTPKGMLGLLHGYDIVQPIVALDGTARASAITMPGAYGLFPSPTYFSLVQTPIATFESGETTDSYRDVLGETISTYLGAFAFAINDPFTRPLPETLDEETPFPLSRELMEKAKNSHALLDTWQAPEGIAVNEIAGWGNPTISGARYYSETSVACPSGSLSCRWGDSVDFVPELVFDGDDTVLAPSARLMDEGVYFDLKKLSKDFSKDISHQDLTESEKIHEYISSLLGITNTYNDTLFVTEEPDTEARGLLISVHSPVLLSIEDSDGKKTGIYPLEGTDLFYIQEEISGSSVEFGNEGKYIFLPENGEYETTISGIGPGTFTLKIHEVEGSGTEFFGAISGLPSSVGMLAHMNIRGDLSEVSPLSVDTNGDGNEDLAESLIEDEIVYLNQVTVPQTKESSSSRENSSRVAIENDEQVLGTTTVTTNASTEIKQSGAVLEQATELLAEEEHLPDTVLVYENDPEAPRPSGFWSSLLNFLEKFTQWIAKLFT